MQRDSEIMCQRIGGAKRQYPKRHRSVRESLDYVVNRAVPTAGEHRVAAVGYRAAGVIGRFLARAANRKFGLHPR